MADFFAGPTPNLPSFSAYLPSAPISAPQPSAPAPEATGTGNWLTAGLGAGAYSAASEIGSGAQAVGTLLGATGFAKSAADYAARNQAVAQTYARDDLEKAPWSLPGMGYQLAKGLPQLAGFLGAGAIGSGVAAVAGPEAAAAAGIGGLAARFAPEIGAGLSALPGAIGGNVQTSEAANGPLTRGQAAEAIGLGLPEAAAQSWVPGKLGEMLEGAAKGGLLKNAAATAAYGAGSGAVTQAFTGLMGDPNRTFADHAQEVISAALSGGFQGGVLGAATHAIAKIPAAMVKTPALKDTVDATLSPPPPPPPEPSPLRGQQVVPYDPRDPSGVQGGQMVLRDVGSEAATTDPTATAPSPPSNLLEGPGAQAALPAPPVARPFADAEKYPDQRLKEFQDAVAAQKGELPPKVQAASEAINAEVAARAQEARPFGDRDEYPDRALMAAQTSLEAQDKRTPEEDQMRDRIGREIAMRNAEASAAQPKLTDTANIYQPGEVPNEAPTAEPGSTIIAPPPADIPSRTFSALPDPDLIHAAGNLASDPRLPLVQQEQGARVTDETRAAAEAAQAKAQADSAAVGKDIFDTVGKQTPQFLKGKTFASRDDAAKAVAEEVQSRVDTKKPLGKQITALADKFEVMGDDGKVKPNLLANPRDPDAPPVTAKSAKAAQVMQDAAKAAVADVPASKAPSRDAIPDNHQPKYDNLEALRAQVTPDMPDHVDLLAKIDDLQTRLQAPKPGAVGQIVKATNDLKRELDGRKSTSERVAATEPTPDPLEPATDQTQPSPAAQAAVAKVKQHYTQVKLHDPAGPQGAAKTEAEARERQARAAETDDPMSRALGADSAMAKAGEQQRARFVAKRAPVPPETPAPKAPAKNQAEAKARKNQAADSMSWLKSRAAELTTQVGDRASLLKMSLPELHALRDQIEADRTRAQEHVGRNDGVDDAAKPDAGRPYSGVIDSAQAAVANVLKRKEGQAAKQPVVDTRDAMEALGRVREHTGALDEKGKVKGKAGDQTTKLQRQFRNDLADHDDKVSDVRSALDAAAQGDMSKLAPIPWDYLTHGATPDDPGFYDKYDGRVDKATQKLMEAHAEAETDLMDQVGKLKGESPLVGDSGPRTQMDVDLKHLVDNGVGGAGILEHIRDNGSSAFERELAHSLIQKGVDPEVRAATRDGLKFDSDRANDPSANVKASYNSGFNRVNVYDASGLEHSLLHESIHPVMDHEIDAGTPVGLEATGLFDRLKARSPDNDAYGLTNAKEMFAEISNPTFRDFLKGERVSTGSRALDMWQAVKNTIFKALGLGDRARTAFDQVMDTFGRAMKENGPTKGFASESPLVVNEATKRAADAAEKDKPALMEQMRQAVSGKLLNFNTWMHSGLLKWNTAPFIVDTHEQLVPGGRNYLTQTEKARAYGDAIAGPYKMASLALEHLTPKQKDIFNAMAKFTANKIDGFKSWEEHPDLHAPEKATAKQLAQTARAKAAWEDAQKAANEVRRDPNILAAYEAARDANHAASLATEAYHMHDLVVGQYKDFGIKGFDTSKNVFDDYNLNPTLHDDPAKARKYWQDTRDAMHKGLSEFQTTLKTEMDDARGRIADNSKQLKSAINGKMDKAVYAALQEKLSTASEKLRNKVETNKALRSPVAEMVSDVESSQKQRDASPYFHLGRDGKYFINAKIRGVDSGPPTKFELDRAAAKLEKTGPLSPEDAAAVRAQALDARLPSDDDIAHIQAHLQSKGFGDVTLQKGLENRQIYFKVRDPAEMAQARKAMETLEDSGHLEKGSLSNGDANQPSIYKSISTATMKRAIAQLHANRPEPPANATVKQKAEFKAAFATQEREMNKALMGMLPDRSMAKVYSKREGVQGYDGDMIKSFNENAFTNARGLANMAAARDLGLASKTLMDNVATLNANPDRQWSANQQVYGAQAVAELITREAQKNWPAGSSPLDTLRGLTHAVQIGMSPMYFLQNHSQLFSWAIPKLGSTHGFMNTISAFAKNTPRAFQAIKRVARGAEATGFGMREKYLVADGGSQADSDFLMRQAAMGTFGLGSRTNSMIPEGHGHLSTAIKTMSTFGLYSEMMPRILTAFAARDLHRGVDKDGDLHTFVKKKVEESFQNWNPDFSPRALGKHGDFGPASPLINQFMGYQIRATERLYKEAADSVGGDAETQMAARKFLGAHLAVVTALAGTLGLPMAGVAASVFDRLADWSTGKDNWDVTAAYRTYLAHTFGKGVGEVIARGVPRLGNMDLDKLGESTIVPGSSTLRILTEKRKLEDVEKDWFKSMGGSSVGVGLNYLSALRDLTNGDYVNALIKVAPEGFKGLAEAGQLAQRGYVDKKGSKLPITAGASDILMKSLGIDPGKEEEYNEEKTTAAGLKSMAQVRSQNISQHLVLAAQRGDTKNFQAWVGQSRVYQQDHPGMEPPIAEFGRELEKALMQQSLARAMGTPLGVTPRDYNARGMTTYGNLRQ